MSITKLVSIFFVLAICGGIQIRKFEGGKIFRVGIYPNVPFQVYHQLSNGTVEWTGPGANIIKYISKYFGLRYTLVVPDEAEIKKRGITNTSIRHITQNEVDISTAGHGATTERAAIMEFSYPIIMDSFRLVAPKPEEISRLLSVIHPFQHDVWVAFFISAVVVIFMLGLVTWFDTSKSFASALIDNAMYFASTVLNQGCSIDYRRTKLRLMAVGWLIAATVLVNSYSGTLTSFISYPRLGPEIKTFEDLAHNHHIQLLLVKNSVLSREILLAESGTYKILGDQMRQNPENLKLSLPGITSLLRTGRYAFPYIDMFCYMLVATEFKKTKTCKFSVSEPLPFTNYGTLSFPKNTNYNDLISLRVMNLWEAGIIQKEVKDLVTSDANPCLIAKQNHATLQRAYSLGDLVAVFVLLGLGLTISLVAYLAELFNGRKFERLSI